MTDPSFRCGWRIQRHRDDQHPFLGEIVTVRRGDWKWRLRADHFDAMSDEDFTEQAARAWRQMAFDQTFHDLGIVVQYIIGQLGTGDLLPVNGMPFGAVRDVLESWQKTRRDMEGET